ncbi:MAG: GldG family protein [Polyangiaceae bacterium]|nr:GldG family protein [Polyangiaceae bacterium]
MRGWADERIRAVGEVMARVRATPLDRWLAASGVVSASVLAVAVNVLVARFYVRWDLTSRGLYSLSVPTVETLRGLTEPVEVVVFLGRSDPLTLSVRHLLAAYGGETRLLEPRYVDPDRDPAEFLALQRRFGIVAGKTEDGRLVTDTAIVVARAEERYYITSDQLVTYDPDDGSTRPRLEQAVTQAIRHVLRRERPTVCFTVGHQEARVDDVGPTGLADLRHRLEKNNYEVVSVDLAAPRPARRLNDCRVVAIIGPEVPFSGAATRSLGAYVDQGGSLFVAAGAMIDDEYRPMPSGLAPLANRAGIELGNDTIVERAPNARLPVGVGERFFVQVEEHAVTRGVVSGGEAVYRVLVSVAQSLRPAPSPPAGVTPSPLLSTSDQAFAVDDVRPFLEGRALAPRARDRRGPFTVAVAAERADSAPPERPHGSRLVFVGTAAVALAPSFRDPSLRGNQLFVESAFAWLAAEPSLVDIPAKPAAELGVTLTEASLGEVSRYVLIYLPVTAVLLGVLTLARRRARERRSRRERRSPGGPGGEVR